MTNRSISLGLFFIAMTTLLFELNLIKIYDTLWSSNLSYMVISIAMFALGVAGIYSSLFPIDRNALGGKVLPVLSILFTITILGTFWVVEKFPFRLDLLNLPSFYIGPLMVSVGLRNIFASMAYITIPFFFSGLILTFLFSSYAKDIQRLYFYDLLGASIGCVIVIPLIPSVAPEGLIVIAAGLALLAAAIFWGSRWITGVVGLLSIIIIAYPMTRDDYLSIDLQENKRGILEYQDKIELTYWDPMARIDVIDYRGTQEDDFGIKWIAYDGGNQTSYFYRFDGDFEQIRKDVANGEVEKHFWGTFVLPSHYLKRDTDQDVLVIGSAGGQEMTAALAYGAKSVDGIELVGKVVELGKTQYADYTGNVFNHPKVNVRKGEGRSFLRSTDKKYDIIQIMSNHTSSSIASGSTALNPTYLQTKEAYIEYFTHLKSDGILHINHHVYPRMLATAATAWKELGLGDFKKHAAVFFVPGTQDNLPTFLVKLSPWTETELVEVAGLLRNQLVVDPRRDELPPLQERLMAGELTAEDLDNIPYQIRPTTDNHPYFNLLRKSPDHIKSQMDKLLDSATARLLNSQITAGLPMDIIHLYVVGAGASIFALLVILVPLLFSKAGRAYWPNKAPTLAYFSLLGLGFILFELVSIQLFMRLIGYPLYTLTTVIFGYLLGAGVGSYSSEKMGITPWNKWWLPFTGILLTSITVLFIHPTIIDQFLQTSQVIRILVTLALILPIAFFLGMAFPLGVLRVSETPYAKQAVAWAWGINGVFTVIGGFLSVVLSIFFGFTTTLSIAIACYILALLVFRRFTQSAAY